MKKYFLFTLLLCYGSIVIAEENPRVVAKLKEQYWVVNYEKGFSNRNLEYYQVLDADYNKGLADANGKILLKPGKYYHCGMDSYMPNEYIKHDPIDAILFITKGNNEWKEVQSTNGKVIIPASRKYTYIGAEFTIHDNKIIKYYRVTNSAGKSTICNAEGKELLPATSMLGPANNRYFYIVDDSKSDHNYGLLDLVQGRMVVPSEYDETCIHHNIYWYGNRSIPNDPKSYHYTVIYDGKEICKAIYVNSMYLLDREKADVIIKYQGENQLWGYINTMTGQVSPAQYNTAEDFENGVAMVTKSGTSFLVSEDKIFSKEEDASFMSLSHEEGKKIDVDENIPQGNADRENTFAIVIANERYENFVVPYAKNDGEVFKQYCLQTLNIPKTNIIYYDNATINNLYAVISRISSIAEVYDEGVKIIFYYSGQGITDNTTKEAYLLPTDGTNKAIASTCFSLKKLYETLATLPNVQQATFFIDAPFNGNTKDGKPMEQTRGVMIQRNISKVAEKVVSFEATSGAENANIYESMGHGLMTYFLLKKLQSSKGNVTIMELSEWIKKEVQTYSVKNLKEAQVVTVKYGNETLLNEKL